MPDWKKAKYKLACSSAKCGLKLIAIGLVPKLTTEVAKRAALGAGSKVLKIYNYQLTSDDIIDIIKYEPDILLLAGGIDGGNRQNIIKNAIKLSEIPSSIPVMKTAELLADGIDDETGIGELMVIDLGGATTDVHSKASGNPQKDNVTFQGLQEPYVKRTIEGDLGMRYSLPSLFESIDAFIYKGLFFRLKGKYCYICNKRNKTYYIN